MLIIFLLLLGGSCLVALVSVRYALASMLLIGFSQDPFRKLVAGEPIYFVVMVGVVFACMFFATMNKVGTRRAMEPFLGWTTMTKRPLMLFSLIIALQFLHSFLRYGNIIISVLGFISYVAPFFAIIVGYFLIESAQDVRKFMKLYVVAGVVVALSVCLSFSGYELSIFKEIGIGIKIYDQGTVLRSFSGVMRTGEIAAWHMATAASFIVILYVTSMRKPSYILVVLIVGFLIVAITLTGRRKMLMLLSMFGVFYFLGYMYFKRKLSVGYLLGGTGLVGVGWLAVEVFFPGGYGGEVQNYLLRGGSVYSDASGRFIDLGLKPIGWAYNRVGILGGGLGVATQGAQLFQGVNVAGGSGEGGLGKVMVELGLPGLIVSFWLVAAFAVYINRAVILSAKRIVPPHIMPLMLGMSVLLGVNVLTFSIATQVYGDMFILLVLGVMSGFLFSAPKLIIGSLHEQQAVTNSTR